MAPAISCSACEAGKYQVYATKGEGSNPACATCSDTCTAGFYESTPCTHSTNRVCTKCPSGTFQDMNGQAECKSCKAACPAGEEPKTTEDGSVLDCSSGKDDRVCQECPPGKYRSEGILSTTDVCLACSSCEGEPISECTKTADTVCKHTIEAASEATTMTQRIHHEGEGLVTTAARQDNLELHDDGVTEEEEYEEDELSKLLAAKAAAKKLMQKKEPSILAQTDSFADYLAKN